MITIFTADNCPACLIMKSSLDKKGYKYEERNIGEKENRMALLQKGILQVPALFYNEENVASVEELEGLC